MNKYTYSLVLAFVISSLLLGPGFVWAREYSHGGMTMSKEMSGCEKQFNSMDSGHKGYITYPEYEAGFNSGTGGAGGIGAHMSYEQSGNAYSRFAAMDKDRNGELNVQEFCGYGG